MYLKRNEKGATILEFALISPFLLFLIFTFIDLALVLFRFNMVNFAMIEVTREAALSMAFQASGQSCSGLETQIEGPVVQSLKEKYFGLDDIGAGDVTSMVVQDGSTGLWVVVNSISAPSGCFMCRFLLPGFTINVTSRGVVENPDTNFNCT